MANRGASDEGRFVAHFAAFVSEDSIGIVNSKHQYMGTSTRRRIQT